MPGRPHLTAVRRPGSRRARGVVVSCALLAAAGCSADPVEVTGDQPAAADREACATLVEALPETLAEAERREVTPTGYAAAWGDDPPLVLTCGVGVPEGFSDTSRCLEVGGVGWYVPPAQEEDLESDVLLTAVGLSPRVSLLVPADLRGGTSASALTQLAGPLHAHLELVDPCA